MKPKIIIELEEDEAGMKCFISHEGARGSHLFAAISAMISHICQLSPPSKRIMNEMNQIITKFTQLATAMHDLEIQNGDVNNRVKP